MFSQCFPGNIDESDPPGKPNDINGRDLDPPQIDTKGRTEAQGLGGKTDTSGGEISCQRPSLPFLGDPFVIST
jgi:hypothetical protein